MENKCIWVFKYDPIDGCIGYWNTSCGKKILYCEGEIDYPPLEKLLDKDCGCGKKIEVKDEQ